MPRIAAANIEEHIRLQTTRILDATSALLSAKGYRGTDMGDIAKSMGLARNSLYRYYPSKDHILVAVLQRDMAPFVEQIRDLEDQISDPANRINAWLDLQIELATGPCHAAIRMLGDMGELSGDLRKEIGILHELPRAVLESSVEELLKGTARDARLVSAMITGMVQQAGSLAMKRDNAADVARELKLSVGKLLDG